jgi:hypothetical protein
MASEILTVRVQTLGNYQWKDYRNLIGFASGIAHVGHDKLLAKLKDARHLLDSIELHSVQVVGTRLEQFALGPPWDASTDSWSDKLLPELAELRRGRNSFEARGGRNAGTWALKGGVAAVIETVTKGASPKGSLDSLILGAIAADIDRETIGKIARPWRIRDGNPDADEALAFEAAMSVDRAYAYRLFDR